MPFPFRPYRIIFCVALSAVWWMGCSSSKSGSPTTAESAWTEARTKFLDGEYLDAERLLDIMKLQFSGSVHADSVQFLLGECNVHQNKYLLAAYEFSAVRRSFPSSPLNRIAQFNIGESYYKLSPPSGIDQEYSKKAIEEYQTFLEVYGRGPLSSDSLTEVASNRIKELRSRLGKKAYDAAELYYKMNQFIASDVYCDVVLEKFYDTEYADRAQILKIRDMVELHRYNEARREIEKFLSLYRASALVPDVRAIRESIENKGLTKQ